MNNRREIMMIVTTMIENVDESGIFPTTKCFNDLEALLDPVEVPIDRAHVYGAIDSERDYQDNAIKGNGSHIVKEFPLGSALSAIQFKLDMARASWYGATSPHGDAMEEIRKIGAICVQMGEKYGMAHRKG